MPNGPPPDVSIDSPEDLVRWLETHSAVEPAAWLVLAKKHVSHRYISHGTVVRTLLAFGWVDSQKRRVDDDHIRLRVSPRKRGSAWSAVNKRHIAELERSGALRPAGAACVAAAKADGSWAWLDDIEALEEPLDLRRALDARPAARENWNRFPPSARKAGLLSVKSAKRVATRAQRIRRIVEAAERGVRPG